MNLRSVAPLAVLLPGLALAACDDPNPAAPAPAASSAPAPVATPAASAVPAVTATASAAPSAPAAAEEEAKTDAMAMVKDPATEKEKTIKAKVGGTVTLYLPDFPGTSWSYEGGDKTLGKPKEETVPGFLGPTTPAHQFTWKTTGPLFKAGVKHHASFVNKKGGQPNGTFKLTVVME